VKGDFLSLKRLFVWFEVGGSFFALKISPYIEVSFPEKLVLYQSFTQP
jgi:hypothetical protein